MNDAEGGAVKLAELLRRPEDLDKIPALKSEFMRKKAAVDTQLKLTLNEQLETTQAGMGYLGDGQRTVNLIKEEMMKIDKLCAEAQLMIRDFPHINLVAQTHRNFSQVEQMKNDIDSFERRLGELEMMLRADDQDMEHQPNLLAAHFELTRLRDIRDTVMEQAKSAEENCMEMISNLNLGNGPTLQDLFIRLDDVIDWFDDHIGTACMQLIDLVTSGNNGLVVRLALVIEEEEKSDKKAKALQDAQNEYRELASRFKSIAAGPKELRGYKEKFLKSIELTAQTQMEQADEMFLENPDKLEKSVRWYFNDLNAVKLGMTKLMPKKWRIFKTYVNIYHKMMHDWLIRRIDDKELKPIHMLAIVHWPKKYYTKMEMLGVSENELEYHLIDNREAELVREYRQLIIKAVEEWMERMSSTDRQSFFDRKENSLDADELGCFRTKTLSDMWRMLHEQLGVAGSSDRSDVTEGVVEAMFRNLKARQTMWEQLVDEELRKYSNSTKDPEGLQPLQDWLVAIANDQIACIDDAEEAGQLSYLTRFSREFEPLVSSQYNAAASGELETLRDGYVDLGTHCISVFVNLIFVVDFRSLLTEFFTPTWYSRKGMGQAVSTFEDYLSDYAQVLHPSLRDVLVEELADELLLRYLSAVRNRGAKFRRAEPFTEKIKDDVLTVFAFFERFDAFQEIKQKWRVVDGFVKLLEADKPAVPGIYERFKLDYWDVQMGWVEAVLRARDDFERSMLNAVKAKAAEIQVERGPETIMSKVK